MSCFREKICLLAFAFLFFLFSFQKAAFSFDEQNLPDSLKPWVSWVMYGHEEEKCPSVGDEKVCQWPSVLTLKLDTKGGDFTQTWKVLKDDWITLPGSEDYWPQNVKVNAQSATVLLHDNLPSLYLKAGQYTVSGSFNWDQIPENFSIPAETGAVKLSLKGKEIPFPRREEDASLWLEQEAKEGNGEDHLEVRVNRKMEDEIPFILVTEFRLDVSGKSREVVLGKPLPVGFVPMSLSSSLPARLDEQGQLHVQVKAGQWTLSLEARHEGPVNEIQWTLPGAPWPNQEIWVFAADNNFRLVSLEGVPTIDPQQTNLPDAWKKLPTYQVEAEATIRFVEKRRGDSDPAPDQLTLNRQWWLDFDGGGFTVQDKIQGALKRSSRLEMNPPMQLGRVAVNGQDQWITKLPGSDREGIEIRQGNLNVSAESRLEGSYRKVSALSWEHNFKQVSGTLNLPPGWKVFAISGVDQSIDTWLNRWSLLDLFVVLIVSIAFYKLAGRPWGILSLVTLALTYKEPDAPQWIWLFLIVGIALVRFLPEGKFRKIVNIYRLTCVLILLVLTLPFMVRQLRVALYPSLEYPYKVLENRQSSYPNSLEQENAPAGMLNAPAPLPQAQIAKDKVATEDEKSPPPKMMLKKEAKLPAPPQEEGVAGGVERNQMAKMAVPSMSKSYVSKNLLEQRPGTKIQTGPGLPKWAWQSIQLNWSGPVSKDQKIFFMLMPPWLNFILAFVRVALLGFFILGLLKFPGKFWPEKIKSQWAMGVAVLIFCMLMGASPSVHAEFPSDNMLNELRERLLEKPECDPNCAAISRMSLEVQGSQLRIRLEVNALVDSSIGIPGGRKEWLPTQASMDGQGFVGFISHEDGSLWLSVPAGVHQVLLEGPLPDQESVSLALPLKPYYVTANASGWSVEGIHENGSVDDTLRLIRRATASTQPASKNGNNNSNVFPPFVKLERHLELGLTWQVHNKITRVGSEGTAVVIEVPLLEGESVTSEGVRVNQNKVAVNMGPTSSEFTWESILAENPRIHLQAPQTNSWMESWILEASPLWHVSWKGIPVIFNQQDGGLWMPEWMPWPGESVEIEVSRPEGVMGQTLTVDDSTLEVSPGLRFTDVKLNTTLRSSLGGQHTFVLPEGAEVQSLSINGQSQAIRQEGRSLTLPLLPGSQTFNIQWQEPGGIKFFFRVPEINLGIKSVNSEIQMHLSDNRWIMLVGGPRMGPAVLIWSLMIVLVFASFALSKSQLTPLKSYEWILLGVGLFQSPSSPIVVTLIVVGWLLALAWRKRKVEMANLFFNFRQIVLWTWALVAIVLLFVAISQGLIGYPDMQIEGNGSSANLLRWFQDRTATLLPRPWVISFPLYLYRISMLAWALWLAVAFIRWLKWVWACMGEGGFWRKMQKVVKEEPVKK